MMIIIVNKTNMAHFTKYAEKKFEILNKYKVFLRREEIEEVILNPDKIQKKNKYYFAEKNEICVIYQKQNKIKKIITFYPLKK